MASPEATATHVRLETGDRVSLSDPDISIHHAFLPDFDSADSSVTLEIGDPRGIAALRAALGVLTDLDSAEGTVTIAAIDYQDGAREYVLTVRP